MVRGTGPGTEELEESMTPSVKRDRYSCEAPPYCAQCMRPVESGHGFLLRGDGRVAHRCCDSPAAGALAVTGTEFVAWDGRRSRLAHEE